MSDRKRILIADSEAWSVALFVNAAKRMGYELHAARNGVSALEKFKSLSPALVVVDTLLPKLDGLQVAKKIRQTELGKVTPLIVTSAIYQAGPASQRLKQTYGFTDFFAKPFSLDDVRGLFTQYLGDDVDSVGGFEEDEGAPIQLPEITRLDLTEMGVPALFRQLFKARKTGILSITHDEITKILFFDRGQLTHASSNSRLDRLGRILVRNKQITLDQYDAARRLQVESSGRLQLGAALVQTGALNENDVVNAVSSQILSSVFNLFSWRYGTWSFLETEQIADQYRRFQFNTASIIFWGLRQLEGEIAFGRFLPSLKGIVELAPDAAQLKESLHLTYFEEQILVLVDGKKRLGEIISIGRLAQIDVERVLFSLLVVGVLEVATEDEQGPDAAESEIGQAVATAELEPAGQLTQTSVARLFGRLYLRDLSGRLTLRRQDEETSVWFEHGEIVYARATAEKHRLANILLTGGKVTDEDYQRALGVMARRPATKIGAIFLELRALSLDELHWALRFQVQQIVLDLFKWSDGEWSFEAGEAPTELITLAATTPNLIMEGTRSTPAPPGIAGLLAAPDTLLMKVWNDYRITRLLRLASAELNILSYIGSGRSIQDVRSLGLVNDRELGSVLHGLLALEVVSAARGAAATVQRPEVAEETAAGEMDSGEIMTPLPGLDAAGGDGDDGDFNSAVTGELDLAQLQTKLRRAKAKAAGSDFSEENQQLKERLAQLEEVLRAMKPKDDKRP